jgi:DNA-binding beta-propeller fold protein YncE
MRPLLVLVACLAAVCVAPTPAAQSASPSDGAARRFLYVAVPGIRNYVEHGGVGVLVFDVDHDHRFVRRIAMTQIATGPEPENVKGIVASAATGRLYVSTIKRVLAFDLRNDALVWNRTYEGGCDRLALSPDGRVLYVPSFEGPHWTIVDALSGEPIGRIETGTGAHNTIVGADGNAVYLAGLKSPSLSVFDPRTRTVARKVGPFGNVIRPFTINWAQTLVFVNVNGLLGFEIGDLRTGKVLHRVEVSGFTKGPTKRHGCPSHGIALTPDERQIWLADAANSRIHVFDATVMPPRQVASIRLRDQPGWITFAVNGQFAYPSTGEIIETATRRIVATLSDETGRAVQSEKMIEVTFDANRVTGTGDQFGVGRRR